MKTDFFSVKSSFRSTKYIVTSVQMVSFVEKSEQIVDCDHACPCSALDVSALRPGSKQPRGPASKACQLLGRRRGWGKQRRPSVTASRPFDASSAATAQQRISDVPAPAAAAVTAAGSVRDANCPRRLCHFVSLNQPQKTAVGRSGDNQHSSPCFSCSGSSWRLRPTSCHHFLRLSANCAYCEVANPSSSQTASTATAPASDRRSVIAAKAAFGQVEAPFGMPATLPSLPLCQLL